MWISTKQLSKYYYKILIYRNILLRRIIHSDQNSREKRIEPWHWSPDPIWLMSSRVSIKKHSWPEADTEKGKYAKSKTGKILFTIC